MSDKKNKKHPELNELKRFELPVEQQDAVAGGNNTTARNGHPDPPKKPSVQNVYQGGVVK